MSNPVMLPVADSRGEHLFWVTESEAQILIAKMQVVFVVRNGQIRKLQATDELMRALAGGTSIYDLSAPAPGPSAAFSSRKTIKDRTHYSHNKETYDNPAKVWTLIKLGGRFTERVFLRVASDCGALIRTAA